MNNVIDERFNALRQVVEGRRIVILGSAPGKYEIPSDFDIISSINGSHAAFGKKFVDIHFLNSFSQCGRSEVNNAVTRAVSDLYCNVSVYVDPPETKKPPKNFHRFQVCISGLRERSQIYSWVSERTVPETASGNGVISTGIFAALLLRKLGGHVQLIGFSLDDGHALTPSAMRFHKEKDAEFFGSFFA